MQTHADTHTQTHQSSLVEGSHKRMQTRTHRHTNHPLWGVPTNACRHAHTDTPIIPCGGFPQTHADTHTQTHQSSLVGGSHKRMQTRTHRHTNHPSWGVPTNACRHAHTDTPIIPRGGFPQTHADTHTQTHQSSLVGGSHKRMQTRTHRHTNHPSWGVPTNACRHAHTDTPIIPCGGFPQTHADTHTQTHQSSLVGGSHKRMQTLTHRHTNHPSWGVPTNACRHAHTDTPIIPCGGFPQTHADTHTQTHQSSLVGGSHKRTQTHQSSLVGGSHKRTQTHQSSLVGGSHKRTQTHQSSLVGASHWLGFWRHFMFQTAVKSPIGVRSIFLIWLH